MIWMFAATRVCSVTLCAISGLSGVLLIFLHVIIAWLASVFHSLRIYPYPMVWPLPRPRSETMVSIPLWAQKTLEIKGFLGLERPFLDLVSQTPRPRGRGRSLFAASFKRAQASWTKFVGYAEVNPTIPPIDLCVTNSEHGGKAKKEGQIKRNTEGQEGETPRSYLGCWPPLCHGPFKPFWDHPSYRQLQLHF